MQPSIRWNFQIASEMGDRKLQQDRLEVFTSKDQLTNLAVLADGLGGYSKGEIAAQNLIDTAESVFQERCDLTPKALLNQICIQCHQRLSDEINGDTQLAATTCVMLLLRQDEAYWAHVGDSRLYHFRGKEFQFRTRDHSLQELDVNVEMESELDSQHSDIQHKLYMCLGGMNQVEPEHGICAVDQNDWFVLCSDGVWNTLELEEFISSRTQDSSECSMAEYLAKLAVQRGKG